MRRIILALGCVAALLGILAAPVSAGSSGVTLATGSFTLVEEQGSHRTFSFVVVELPDGGIRGEAQWITFAGDVAHINLNCVTLVGNQAIIGGTVTSSTNPDLIGASTAFAIQDNPDIISLLSFDDVGVTCANLLDLYNEPDISGLFNEIGIPIQQGNVVIRQPN